VLNILSAEIAISINNARLYYNLNNINKAYERFVPRQFLSFLNKDSITELRLGDQVQKEMAVMFADIRNFTALSEKLTPEANFNFLNDYLGKMEPMISQYHGFVDKYIGDEIMALFPTGAEDALNAAIAMLTQLESYNKTLVKSGIKPIKIGIGINAGSLMLGIIGGENRWDGTVISDAVNLASRIEELTREYSVPLLISEFTWTRLENPAKYSIRKIDRLKVKGKSKAVTVYEVFDADPPAVKQLKKDSLNEFKAALKDFKDHQYAEAMVKFKHLAELNPKDSVVLKYLQRCEKASND
jgi:class 3 adenylate cyclase